MLKEGRLYRDNEAKGLIVLKIKSVMPNGDYEAKVVKSYKENLLGSEGIIDKMYENAFDIYQQKIRRLK